MRDLRKVEGAVRARELVIAVYRITGPLPSHERYGLAAQMRRAAVPIASNVAEGTGRGGDCEFLRFLYIALGSATELAIQVDLAIALDFIDAVEGVTLVDHTNHVQRMLNRLTGSLRRKVQGADVNSTERRS